MATSENTKSFFDFGARLAERKAKTKFNSRNYNKNLELNLIKKKE